MKNSGDISCPMIHCWTFSGLVGAFLDLTLALFMLCGATAAFFATKFLELFGQHLPCPCQGLFGRPNGECLHEILAHYSPRKISNIQSDLKRQFPFNSVWTAEEGNFYHSNLWKDRTKNDAVPETSRSDSISSWNRDFDESPSLNEGDDHFLHPRKDLRRRRCNLAPDMRKSPFESPSSRQNPNHSPDVLDIGSIKSSTEYKESESSAIRILERALEEEQTARSSLYLELEKERNAAATAADEAMAMILRLQKEKASIEMEARQFERIVEERTAYDEEEMNILKEIIVRIERENHVLEREIEFYRQTVVFGDVPQQQPNLEFSTEDRIQDSGNLEIAKFSKRGDELDQCCLSPCHDSPKIHDQSELGTSDDISNDEASVSLSKTGKTDSDDRGIVDHDMNTDENTIAQISKESDFSICDAIFESYGSRKVDLTRRYSGSTCLEAERNVHKNISGSRKPLLPVNMSYDSFSLSKLRRNSMSAVDRERSKLEAEVEFLRDRLKIIQNGREKLGFSENKEKENCQLRLLEEIVSQLCAIRKIARTGKTVNLVKSVHTFYAILFLKFKLNYVVYRADSYNE